MENLRLILAQYWGYSTFRPLQEEAMLSVLGGRDSLVVMPTGGGKSICFQAPALAMDGMAVVVSPLISLMKDQVDFLRACGVEAACIHSGLNGLEKREIDQAIRGGNLKLLYVAPERLATDAFLHYLRKTTLSFFAIDEAHCISHWGHDFRPHYRQLRQLKDQFDGIPIHAYTATATDPVREDICKQLGLENPEVFVGDFHRPNLSYSVERETNRVQQVLDRVEAHTGESGIVYCPSRKKVEDMAQRLVDAGHSALPYHAGMEDYARKRNQEAFARDEADIIVATVAFGMGIDKSNVRFVIHAGMPKSLEHYQQESGRAGRDGLRSECLLIYSKADHGFWRRLLSELEDEVYAAAMRKLDDMYAYCTQVTCRHRKLVTYFGQDFLKKRCDACDVCLNTVECHEDSLDISQHIIEGVRQLGSLAGPSYTALVLSGSREQRIMDKGHNKLPSWGVLAAYRTPDVRDWIEQLVGQGFLRKEGEYSILALTAEGEAVCAGEADPRLLKPMPPKKAKPKALHKRPGMEGVDEALFEMLRQTRLGLARARSVPAYIICGDATLRDMAIQKPLSFEALLAVQGIGDKKANDFGDTFLRAIEAYIAGRGDTSPAESTRPSARDKATQELFSCFADAMPLEEAAGRNGVSRSRAFKLLKEYLLEYQILDASPWVPDNEFDAVSEAVSTVGDGRLRTIHDYLEGRVALSSIEVALVCIRNGDLKRA